MKPKKKPVEKSATKHRTVHKGQTRKRGVTHKGRLGECLDDTRMINLFYEYRDRFESDLLKSMTDKEILAFLKESSEQDLRDAFFNAKDTVAAMITNFETTMATFEKPNKKVVQEYVDTIFRYAKLAHDSQMLLSMKTCNRRYFVKMPRTVKIKV